VGRRFSRCCGSIGGVDVAGAAKLARRRHRGEIDEAGAPFAEHLERAAALVATAGGGRSEQMAVWLSGVAQAGIGLGDLAALRVPRRVIRILGVLPSGPAWESAASHAERISSCPGAGLVLLALLTDRYRPEALSRIPAHRAARDHDLLRSLGLAVPPGLAEPVRARAAGDVTTLLAQLHADNPGRWQAVQVLAARGEPRAFRPLIDAYLAAEAGDPRWASGRTQLSKALSGMAAQRRHQDDPQWVQLLAGLAGHSDAFLRATAIRGLAGLADYQALVVRALSDDSPQVAGAAIAALDAGRAGEVSRELVAIARRREGKWKWARRAAVRRLVGAGDLSAHDVLVAAFEVDGLGLGHDLVSVLVGTAGPSIVPELIRQLHGTGPGRVGAAFVLGELRARESVGDLLAVLAEERPGPKDPRLSVTCIGALAKIADPAAVPALARACRHPMAWVRAAALEALARFDDPLLIETALEAVEDFDPDVRQQAVRLLALRGDRRATSRLLSACEGPLAAVALRGLIRLSDERAVPRLARLFYDTTDRRVRHLAGRAIACSARNASGLYLGGEPTQLRATAWVLGEIGDKNSRWKLARLLTHFDERVRARSAAALGKIGDPASAAQLEAVLDDVSPRVRASAASALGQLGNVAAQEQLKPLLHDPHPAVRMAAAAALRRLHSS
jgi:HEAT repeat protein